MREAVAGRVADYVKSKVAISIRYPKTAIILGTGWGDVLMDNMVFSQTFHLADLPEFHALRDMQQIQGHHRELVLAFLKTGQSVAMLRGRIHMNENHSGEELAKMVRLQVEMLIKLGVKNLVLTNAAGSLRPEVKVGNIVIHDSFVTLFAPPLPLWAGEFVSPEDTLLKGRNGWWMMQAIANAGLVHHYGAGAMVRGPYFEGRKHDKRILSECGATMAMMSILPEAAIAALYPQVNVYAMSFITNTASEEHSHEENQKRAKESSAKLGCMLLNLINYI